MGLFAGALIKKRRYWPSLIPGDRNDAHFDSMNIGDVHTIMGEQDGFPYSIWGMKDPGYVMKIMATVGTLISDDSCKTTHRGLSNDRGQVFVHATL